MNMSHEDIRTLRQRLGWSMAEMARQMGCTTDLIQTWESGAAKPDIDALNQLHYLHYHVELKSNQVAQSPIAEREMESRKMAQLTNRDLLEEIK